MNLDEQRGKLSETNSFETQSGKVEFSWGDLQRTTWVSYTFLKRRISLANVGSFVTDHFELCASWLNAPSREYCLACKSQAKQKHFRRHLWTWVLQTVDNWNRSGWFHRKTIQLIVQMMKHGKGCAKRAVPNGNLKIWGAVIGEHPKCQDMLINSARNSSETKRSM